WGGIKEPSKKVLFVSYCEPADIMISKMIQEKSLGGEKWLVLSNDRFETDREKLEQIVRNRIREGKLCVPDHKSEDVIVTEVVETQLEAMRSLVAYLDGQ